MGGELVKNYRQLDNNFSLLSFYWTTIINNWPTIFLFLFLFSQDGGLGRCRWCRCGR
jgi:hypothetical protein